MKVTTIDPPATFKPVVITLETQEEVDQLIGVLVSQVVAPYKSSLDMLFEALLPHHTNEGALRANEEFRARAKNTNW